jgi:YHS domain-containing protein
MIALLGLLLPRVVPQPLADRARDRLNTGGSEDSGPHAHQPSGEPSEHEPFGRRIRSRRGWGDAAGYTISDLSMLRKELVIGFVVAGYLAALVPTGVWRSLFLTGHGFWSALENVVLGPVLAIISFVCSVGNVPLAAALWQGGISFGGVIAFVFADLITLPLLAIYRKYFGTAVTLRILATFWATMSAAGLAVEYLFRAVRLPAPARPAMVVHTGFAWNYTTVLNIVALAGFAVIYWLYRHRDTTGERYAKDPVCGMQVEIALAPATASAHGRQFWFCSDHCRHRFTAEPDRFLGSTAELPDPAEHMETDPMCGMTVDPHSCEHTAERDGRRYYFCGAGCRAGFLAEDSAGNAAEDAGDPEHSAGARP